MTPSQFDLSYRSFCGLRPFRKFQIEFDSGAQVLIAHPEAVRREGKLYAFRSADGANVVFGAESVSRFLDVPITTTKE